ncbi:MAG: aspartate-semialdehyde dehydrogenase [Planctomycetota bacterium]
MPASGLSIAIVGATGAVGHEFLRILEQRKTPISQLRLFASARSAGSKLTFRGKPVAVEPLSDESLTKGIFKGTDVVLLSAGASISRKAVPAAIRDGAIAIDNSSAFREDPSIPLVIPEINGRRAHEHKGIIANPNCTAAVLLMAAAPLHRAAGIKRMVISSYQAVSGKGAKAMDECVEQTRALLAIEGLDRTKLQKPAIFPRSMAFNVLPHIDDFKSDGRTGEEIKIENESRKILELSNLSIDATCVRVPVLRCHSISATIEFEQKLSPDEARAIWKESAGVIVMDDPGQWIYPTPIEAEGRDEVFVGRCRASRIFENGLSFWCVGDQLRKGAALNAIQIMEACSINTKVS